MRRTSSQWERYCRINRRLIRSWPRRIKWRGFIAMRNSLYKVASRKGIIIMEEECCRNCSPGLSSHQAPRIKSIAYVITITRHNNPTQTNPPSAIYSSVNNSLTLSHKLYKSLSQTHNSTHSKYTLKDGI